MPIRVLPPEVANKIAAGEVIERPASVIKELLENAIDAESSEIRVDIAQGGRRLMRVHDDGCGIPAAEVELAFARHATSKLSSADELFRIQTLGFRGEALASIAAVSRLTLTTRTADEQVGTRVRLEGAALLGRDSVAQAVGTTVQVENLFYNTPARLKFLKTDASEAGHIARLVHCYALAYPERRLQLQNNDRLVIRTPGTGSLYDVLVTLYGLDVAEEMLEIPAAEESEGVMRVWGYIGAPSLHRANRQDIILIVNRRWIQDNTLAYAIEEAYHTLLPGGRHPMAVLNVAVPPDEVDVNIHPTKREVRFRRGRELFTLVQRAVRTLLMTQRPVPVVGPTPRTESWGDALSHPVPLVEVRYPSPEQTRLALELQHTGDALVSGLARGPLAPPPSPTPEDAARPMQRLPMLRVLGQVAQTYIVAEGPGGIYLIDQHAAHERIRYEELMAVRASASQAAQELLQPLPVELTPQQSVELEPHLDILAGLGLEIVPFGGNTFLVKRVPASLQGEEIGPAIVELVDLAHQSKEGFSWEEQALVTLSCHTAVRAGQTLSLEEMRDLVRQLERTALPHTCPHGRPTMVHLTQAQLEREFGRR
jgi:DNA mismatch repair protein MutL